MYNKYCLINNIKIDNKIDYNKKNNALAGINNCNNCFYNTLIYNNNFLVCNRCGYIDNNIELINYNNIDYEKNKSFYKREHHLKELLDNLQCKNIVDDDIIEQVRKYIKILNIDIKELTFNNIKYCLKKLYFNKLYERIYYIHYKIIGKK